MSLQSQIKNMKLLAELLSHDLGSIYGECECGPNGAKKQFLSIGRTFLAALGKDLGFSEKKISVNKAGIAVSGEVTLMGMWGEKNGLYLQLYQDAMSKTCILYRSIEHLKDYRGGRNNFVLLSEFRKADYAGLILKLLGYGEVSYDRSVA